MMFILRKNKGNSIRVARPTGVEFFAVIPQNKPWPFGLRLKSPSCLSKCWPVDALQAAHFFARYGDFSQQRNILELANSA